MQLELQGEIEPFELSNNLCYKVLELVLLRIIDQFQVGQNFLVVHQIVRDHGWVVLYVQETCRQREASPPRKTKKLDQIKSKKFCLYGSIHVRKQMQEFVFSAKSNQLRTS